MNNVINFLKTRRSTTAKTMISGHINESDLKNTQFNFWKVGKGFIDL